MVRPKPLTLLWLALVLLGTLLGGDSDAQGASAYESAHRSAGAYLHYSLGRLMELQGMLPEALVQYRRAASADPGQCAVETAVARVLFTLGRIEDARPAAESAYEACPDSEETVALLGAIALSDGDPEGAESVVRGLATVDGAPTELPLLLAQSLLAQGRTQEAEEILSERARTDSLSPRLAHLHARVLLAIERPEDALRELMRVYRAAPDDVAIVELATRVLMALDRPEEAAAMLDDFLDAPRARPRHTVSLARIHAGLGRGDGALEAVERGIRRFGETPVLLRTLGSIHFDAGRVEAALGAYEKALSLNPDSVQALNFLAYTLADLDIDAERAVELAARAVELDPESGIVRDTLGWAYFKLGRFDEAVAELRMAIELGESDPVILEHLGDALSAQGKVEEAVQAWERALEADPDSESAAGKIGEARADSSRGANP